MPGRQFNAGNYRYGMNGQENDNEITGNVGTHTSAEYWEYDTRLGRRWNRDPVTYSHQSTYACFNNNPIYFADPLGLEGEDWYKGKNGKVFWKEGDAATAEFEGETYENIGATYTQNDVVDGNIVTSEFYQNMLVGSKVKPIDYSAYENGKISTRIENGLKRADKWINSFKGGAFDGREWEGPDGVVQFDAGARYKVNVAGMFQNTTEAKITSRHENYSNFVVENKTSANWKVGANNKLVNPFDGMNNGNFTSAAVEGFAKVSISDPKVGDFSVSQTIPLGYQGAYIRVNTSYNIIQKTTRIQSIEMGYTSNPATSIETTIKTDLIKVDATKRKVSSIAD